MDNGYTPMNVRCPADLVFSRVNHLGGKLFMPWKSISGREVMIALASDPGNPIEGMIEAVTGQGLVVMANRSGHGRREVIPQANIHYIFVKRIVTAEQLEHWRNRKYMINQFGWVGRSRRLASVNYFCREG